MRRKSIKTIYLILLIVLSFVACAFVLIHRINKSPLTKGEGKGKVSFNVRECFSCYGCHCTYTINDKEKYFLNESDKTKCLYDLESGQTGKYHELIKDKLTEQTETVDIYLENNELREVLDCLKKYSD